MMRGGTKEIDLCWAICCATGGEIYDVVLLEGKLSTGVKEARSVLKCSVVVDK